MFSNLHNLSSVQRHDVVNMMLVEEQIPEESQGLEHDIVVFIGEEPEDLVRAEPRHDLNLDPLLGLKSHILEEENSSRFM